MRVVVDASVALKWFFRDDGEQDSDAALELLLRVSDGRLTLVQPPHFVAEVSAVLARESPDTAMLSLRRLIAFEMEVETGEAAYARAVALSVRLGHHLFDTLYHAVALENPQTLLITADDRYYRKARSHGHIVRLADFDG